MTRSPHRILLLELRYAFLVCLFALVATPALYSQDISSEQNPTPGYDTPGVALPPSSTFSGAEVSETALNVPAPAEDQSDDSRTLADQPQDPQAQTKDNPNPAATYQPVTWKNLPIRILGDQKLIWLFPLHLAQGQHVLPSLGVVGVTGGLIAADPHIMLHLRNHTSAFDEFDEIFSGTNTGIATALIPVSFYLYGVVRKSSYSEQTALLAGEAYLDSAIPHVAIKLVSRRLRPDVVPSSSDFSDTFFKSRVSVLGKGSSFPSGHAAGIFSIATVVAERYRRHRWVPWVAYGLAGVISFSRVPTFAHFPSDVFLGAALGYTITRFDVLRDRTH